MSGAAKHLSSINASPESPTFREEMQKKDGTFDVVARPKGIPMKATPVTKSDPGLGAATLPHPYKAGKPRI